MSKMIAVCGAPGSGKTTAALKIAEEIYYAKKVSVIFLSPDLNVPYLAFVFPNCKEEELYSVGVALDRTDIYREDVLRQMNHVKTMENFGFLGYKAGENKYSYPRPTEDKILNLFSILRELADYVIVDCADGLISSMAKSHADMLVQLNYINRVSFRANPRTSHRRFNEVNHPERYYAGQIPSSSWKQEKAPIVPYSCKDENRPCRYGQIQAVYDCLLCVARPLCGGYYRIGAHR